jgi:SAM-dependent methyltransferase
MSIGRLLAWPFRRLLDPRFGGLAEQADEQHLDLAERLEQLNRRTADRETIQRELAAMRQELVTMRNELLALPAQELAAMRRELTSAARADMEATREANELLARTLGDLLAESTATTMALEEVLGRSLRTEATVPGTADGLDSRTAELLNYASTHRGFAAQRGLWFNPPISIAYEKGGVRPTAANERIVELPYVYRALAGAPPGSSVLDVGAAESTLAFSLASIGFEVTAVDLHPYPLSHPRLEAVEADILDWEPNRTFDVVLCVSTLEHIGLGAYGDTPHESDGSADRRALERLRELTRPSGLLILTVPFGAASGDLTQRGYDRAALERLLADWSVEDLTIVRRQDHLTWIPEDGPNPDGAEATRRVALVTATRPSE